MSDDGAGNKNGEILDRLYRTNPAARKVIQRELKKENPSLVFPELEIEEATAAVAKTFGDKLEETSSELQRERIERARDKMRTQWKEKGYEPDDVEAVIKEFGLEASADPFKAASKILDAQRVSAAGEAAVKDRGRMGFSEDWKSLMNKPDSVINAAAQDIAHKAVDEVIASKRAEAMRFRPTK